MNGRKLEARLRDFFCEELHASERRIIDALKPKTAKRYVSRGNGMRGPKTRAMAGQLCAFEAFLAAHPVTGDCSRITRAHRCWIAHPEWIAMAAAKGEDRGYSSYKALAAAK